MNAVYHNKLPPFIDSWRHLYREYKKSSQAGGFCIKVNNGTPKPDEWHFDLNVMKGKIFDEMIDTIKDFNGGDYWLFEEMFNYYKGARPIFAVNSDDLNKLNNIRTLVYDIINLVKE